MPQAFTFRAFGADSLSFHTPAIAGGTDKSSLLPYHFFLPTTEIIGGVLIGKFSLRNLCVPCDSAVKWQNAHRRDAERAEIARRVERTAPNHPGQTRLMTTPPTKIFVADDISDTGLQPLRDAGFVVEKRVRLASPELDEALKGCAGLVVRSETKVTSHLMDNATALRVIGRAGVGVDNIDVPAATERGIVVMNAPDGNTITTAEHTIALLIALARRIPQANSSLKSGRWERKAFVGVELQGKTLGVVGMGRIGRTVAARARAFGDRKSVV